MNKHDLRGGTTEITYVSMSSTRTIKAVLLCFFVPKHKLRSVEIIEFDPCEVFVQQKLTQLNVLVHDHTILITMKIRQCFRHVQTYSKFLAACNVVVNYQFLLFLVFFNNVMFRVVIIIDCRLFQVAMWEPFRPVWL